MSSPLTMSMPSCFRYSTRRFFSCASACGELKDEPIGILLPANDCQESLHDVPEPTHGRAPAAFQSEDGQGHAKLGVVTLLALADKLPVLRENDKNSVLGGRLPCATRDGDDLRTVPA